MPLFATRLGQANIKTTFNPIKTLGNIFKNQRIGQASGKQKALFIKYSKMQILPIHIHR